MILMAPTTFNQRETKSITRQTDLQCNYRPGSLLLDIFGHPATRHISTFLTILLSSIVFFIIYPNVDSTSGFSVLQLQLSFDIERARYIVTTWGDQGLYYYVKWLFMGYLLAIAYWVMLTGLLIRIRRIKNPLTQQQNSFLTSFPWILLLPTLAGTLDIIENTLHLYFLSNQLTSELGFQVLCFTSAAKWTTLAAILVYLASSNSSNTLSD